jgi:biopolymer transport protein ExbB/TolQ/biopolymer transport protein ExbD
VFRPFITLFIEGGWVLYPIFAVAVLVWHIAIGKIIRMRQLRDSRRKAHALLMVHDGAATARTGFREFDRFVVKLLGLARTPETIDRAFDELVIAITPGLNRGLSTIAASVVVAPLLGLLGTISGMNEMFSVIGMFGFGNPTIMANGISMALQATLTGLAVAVCALLFLDYLKTEKQKLLDGLREDRDAMLRETLAAHPQIKPLEETSMNSGFRPIHEEHQNPEINLAPFVDTILILLIFFVVTANLYIETGVDVSKPKAQSAKPAGQKALMVGITREGTIHVFGRQINIDRLRTVVEREVTKQPEMSVVIVADRDGMVGRTVEVIDQCTLGGAQKISIAAGKE